MKKFLRNALAILLPIVVLGVVPFTLVTVFYENDTHWSAVSPLVWLSSLVGGVLFIGGLIIACWCVVLFIRRGEGTLAPWDPPVNLVAQGPYRYTRNPMIGGGILLVAGLALLWGSWIVGAWAVFLFLLNHFYFIKSEEPGLEKRFGENYLKYKAAVPRWLPRTKPWEGAK